MAGYIGSKASVVSSGAERKKTFTITGATTSLTGLNYTVGKVHVFQNGVRLVDGTDYTATNSTTITLTVAAQSGDNVVVISQASYQVALSGIDDQSNAVAMTIDSNENIGIGTSSPSAKLHVANATTEEYIFETTSNNTRSQVEVKSKDSSGNAVQTRIASIGDGVYGMLYTLTNHNLTFATNNAAPQMTLDTSGNVGIGVVPESGVSADVTELDLGLLSLSLWKGEGQPNDGASYGYNCYKTGGLTYKAKVSSNSGDFRPAVYEQIYGQHRFKVASSATADSTISFNEAMLIDNSGRVTMPYQPSFSVSKTGGLVSSGTFVVWNHVEHNVGSHYNTSNGIFTAPVSGVYAVSLNVMDESTAIHVNKEVDIYRNSYIYQRVYGTNGYASSHGRWTWSGNIYMSANDTLKILVNNMTIYGNQRDYSNFSGFLVG